MKLHSPDEKRIQCQKCTETFSTEYNFDQHCYRKHNGWKPFMIHIIERNKADNKVMKQYLSMFSQYQLSFYILLSIIFISISYSPKEKKVSRPKAAKIFRVRENCDVNRSEIFATVHSKSITKTSKSSKISDSTKNVTSSASNFINKSKSKIHTDVSAVNGLTLVKSKLIVYIA